MFGLDAVMRSVRVNAAVGAVVAVSASLLAVVGLAPAANAADTIAFRASAEAFFNQPSARVTIPASVRETDGMLLFVTKNNAAATGSSDCGRRPWGNSTTKDHRFR